MSFSHSFTIHRKSGPSAYGGLARTARHLNLQPSTLIHDRGPDRIPEAIHPLRDTGAAPGPQAIPCRCIEKGCVFPADQSGAGICRQHRRERREPTLFHSLQVTGLLLDAAKLGLPNSKRDLERHQDRRRREAIRQRFLEELA